MTVTFDSIEIPTDNKGLALLLLYGAQMGAEVLNLTYLLSKSPPSQSHKTLASILRNNKTIKNMSQLKYTVDIVMCIDATGSMHPVIGRVKENALKFYEDLKAHMESKSKSIDTLRVRVIVYRDYYNDGDKSMLASQFFILPDEKEDFADFVNDIEADGGGDEPECGLEAVALAIKSEWNKTGDKRRQIIVIWTDASTHPLEKNAGSKPSNYPTNIAKDLDELTDLWEGQYGMSKAAKRLIIYSPDAYAWSDIATNWNNTIQYPSKAGAGLEEVDYQTILDAIAASV